MPASLRGRRAWIAAALVALAVSGGGANAAERGERAAERSLTLDYLMIRGNEGGSSGGHAAIRFDAETYHFEHADGLLRLGREASDRFQHIYRTLQNRDIELTRVAVSADTYARLRDAFELRTLVQDRQLAIADELRADRELLSALRDAGRRAAQAAAPIEVAGAGFFAAGPDPAAAAHALPALRARIEALHGAEFLALRSAAVDHALATLAPEVVDADAIELDADRLPALAPSFSRRVESLLAARLALEILARPRALAPAALVAGAEALAFSDADRARLRSAADALREDLAQLAASRRDDFGPALLLGMARLAALEASLRSERWVLLDPFPPQSERLAVTPAQREWLPSLLREAESDFASARRELLALAGFPEQAWNDVEAAAARWLELRGAAAGAAAIRVHAGVMIPAARAPLPAPEPADADLGALALRAGEMERRYRERLKALAGYDLLRRNCVSEIFRTLDAGLAADAGSVTDAGAGAAGAPGAARDASARELGGYVDPVAGLNFIPFVSSLRVRDRWRVVETVTLPSYRRFRLAQMERSEAPLVVALRESNVLTARSHRVAAPESFFVFFGDARVPLRPLFGALNVGAGLVRSALGLLELPFDGGRGLRSGLSGVVFSLPELAFQNLRKGYNDYVPPDERPPPG